MLFFKVFYRSMRLNFSFIISIYCMQHTLIHHLPKKEVEWQHCWGRQTPSTALLQFKMVCVPSYSEVVCAYK
jgi:hypothetical protein